MRANGERVAKCLTTAGFTVIARPEALSGCAQFAHVGVLSNIISRRGDEAKSFFRDVTLHSSDARLRQCRTPHLHVCEERLDRKPATWVLSPLVEHGNE